MFWKSVVQVSAEIHEERSHGDGITCTSE